MFFFFVGGVEQQAGRVIRSNAGRCITCGSPADLVEYERVLKLFFVPVWRWPGKGPAFNCRGCNLIFPSSLPPKSGPTTPDLLPPDDQSPSELLRRCGCCDRVVEPNFLFCPLCGDKL